MRHFSRSLAAAVLTIGCAHFAQAAITVGNSTVQIGGFFSQGYINSSKNNYPFDAKGGTWDFREMGVNVSTPIGSHLRIGAQGFAQRLGNYGEDQIKLDWAVADYNFRQEIGLRAGRIKYPKGLYGEALDLDALRPFVFLPSSVYSPVLRDFSASFDGGMLYGTLPAGKSSSVDYKVFYGTIAMNPDQGVADFFNTGTTFAAPGINYLKADDVYGAAVDWATPVTGLKVHLSYSHITSIEGRGRLGAVPSFAASLRVDPTYYTAGVEYVHNDWTFAAEFSDQRGGAVIQAPPIVNVRSTYGIRGYYVSAARRLGAKWEVGAYFSHSENSEAAANVAKADKQLEDWALSVRYNVNDYVTVKLEGHAIDGRYNIFNTPRTPNPTRADSMSFFAAKTTFTF